MLTHLTDHCRSINRSCHVKEFLPSSSEAYGSSQLLADQLSLRDTSEQTLLESPHNITKELSPVSMGDKRHASLEAIIEDGDFWTLSNTDLLHVIRDEFSDELEYLKSAYSVRGRGWKELPGSPSRIVFPNGKVYDEINRTLVGVLALRWINDNDYDQFVGGQPQAVRLERESFDWIRNIFKSQGILHSRSYKLYALVTSMVSNDLGKSTSFIKSYIDATGDDIGHLNHDMVLHKAAQRGMVQVLERLRSEYRDHIKRGIKLGGEFNVGQFAQAENAPASLAPVLDLLHHEDAWNMRWMEQLLDLAGAAGHEDHTCARKLIEPIFRSYRSTYDVVTGIVQGKYTLREGYDHNLIARYRLINKSGWQPPKAMSIQRPHDRALMRLCCLGNVADPQAANLYYETFNSTLIGDNIRQRLIQHLNRDGSVERPAVQPSYAPAMLSLALTNIDKAKKNKEEQSQLANGTSSSKEKILASVLKYLTRVLAEPPTPEMMAEGNVTVIERDCRVSAKQVIESSEFVENPDILDSAPLPEDAVANRLRDATKPSI